MVKPTAAKAVSATDAVVQVCTIVAARTISRIPEIVASIAVLDFIAVLTLVRERGVNAANAFLEPISIEAVFVIATFENQIASFAVCIEMAVSAIFVL